MVADIARSHNLARALAMLVSLMGKASLGFAQPLCVRVGGLQIDLQKFVMIPETRFTGDIWVIPENEIAFIPEDALVFDPECAFVLAVKRSFVQNSRGIRCVSKNGKTAILTHYSSNPYERYSLTLR